MSRIKSRDPLIEAAVALLIIGVLGAGASAYFHSGSGAKTSSSVISQDGWCAPVGITDNSCWNALLLGPENTVIRVSLGHNLFDRTPALAGDYLTKGGGWRLVKVGEPEYAELAAIFANQEGHPGPATSGVKY